MPHIAPMRLLRVPGERIGMESVPAHPLDRWRSFFSRSVLKASSPSIGFTRSLLRSS